MTLFGKRSSTEDGPVTVSYLLAFMVFPYAIGIYLSNQNLPFFQDLWSHVTVSPRILSAVPLKDLDDCYNRFVVKMHGGKHPMDQDKPFDNLQLVLHRNGDAIPCGNTGSVDVQAAFRGTIEEMGQCPTDFNNKYQWESLLTRTLHRLVSTCPSLEPERTSDEGFLGFCDMGEARTPIQLDHDLLVPIQQSSSSSYWPCHFHSREGIRISAPQLLAGMARAARRSGGDDDDCTSETCPRQLHLYAVPAGRMFQFAASHVGEIIRLPHIRGGDPTQPVYLQVLSTSPRVFDLFNFFTKEEGDDLVAGSLQESRDSHRIKRSSTGTSGYTLNRRRTSESGFDSTSPISIRLKRRCFDVLGFDQYLEPYADGLQILRYNMSTAYIPHMDYLDVTDLTEHDFDSALKGGNRYATILLYFTTHGDKAGGETVFTEAWPVGQAEEDRVDVDEAIRELRESGEGSVLTEGSWEETMVAKCRTRLAVHPRAGHSVLFYSQLPNGQMDRTSLHGGCPVLEGTKYAANLWVWSTPRDGYENSPRNPNYKPKSEGDSANFDAKVPGQVMATFGNTGSQYEEVDLYYGDDQFWATLSKFASPVHVNTFKSHRWVVKKNGEVLKTWTIVDDAKEDQEFMF